MSEKTALLQQPILSYAFRPFYWFGALVVIISLLAWRPGDIAGSVQMPSFLWHAHEMIWGFASAIVIGFLLTAVATWTSQPATRGFTLLVLFGLWLAGRFTALLDSHWITGGLGVLFFVMATVCFALPIIKSKNTRNLIAVLALVLLGGSQLLFHLSLDGLGGTSPLQVLHAGLMIIAAFIGLIGMRVIPFFISKKLSVEQVTSPMWVMLLTLLLPIVLAIAMVWFPAANILILILALVLSVIVWVSLFRWHSRGIWHEPLLWVLFVGYGLSNLGILLLAIGYAYSSFYITVGVHLLAVGGIGVLTLGMMIRTALGHTGRPIAIGAFLTWAIYLMILATVMRFVANWHVDNLWLMSVGSVLFSASFAMYLYYFTGILWRKRL